jgi:hypothetical protein
VDESTAREVGLILLNNILSPYSERIGADFTAYKNHSSRVFCYALRLLPKTSEPDIEKVAIAAAFHDLGLWTDDTFDYLAPSAKLAQTYLKNSGRDEWSVQMDAMINFHHKITSYPGLLPLVEIFRKADLADVSLGFIRSGIPENLPIELKSQFPNAGFHKMLIRREIEWLSHHPLNPLPMMKW